MNCFFMVRQISKKDSVSAKWKKSFPKKAKGILFPLKVQNQSNKRVKKTNNGTRNQNKASNEGFVENSGMKNHQINQTDSGSSIL